MSWSVTVIGRPDKVVAELDKYGDSLNGQSRDEFTEAKPHLVGLVKLTVGDTLVVRLEASGHASFESTGFATSAKVRGACIVKLEPSYATLAV
jgi:hypothetical protein